MQTSSQLIHHNQAIIPDPVLLLWYGFLGVRLGELDIKYIYNFNYNM